MTTETEATEATEAEAFRWCRGGPPNADRSPLAMPEMLDGLGPGLVVCGCPWAWHCEDPETFTPHDELHRRKASRGVGGRAGRSI